MDPMKSIYGVTRLDPLVIEEDDIERQSNPDLVNVGPLANYTYGPGDDVHSSGALNNDNVNMGAGNNRVVINDATHTVQNSTISSGTGSDLVTVISSAGHGIRNSQINTGLGSGADRITIRAMSQDSGQHESLESAYNALGSASFYSQMGGATGSGFGMQGSAITAKSSGANAVTINAGICGIQGSKNAFTPAVETGNGNDTISVNAGWQALRDTSLRTGAGNDQVRLTSEYDGAVTGSTIDLGSGNDTIFIESKLYAKGQENQSVFDKSYLIAGSGDDLIEIRDDYVYMYGNRSKSGVVQESMIDLGSGSDTLRIIGTQGYSDRLYASGLVFNTQIVSDNDDTQGDHIYLSTLDYASTTIRDSSIETGAGGDNIEIRGYYSSYYGSPVTMSGSSINTYDGDDTISIFGRIGNGSYVDAGDGNDFVTIGGSIGDGNPDMPQTIISLGNGNDTVELGAEITSNGLLDGGDNDQVDLDSGNLGDIVKLHMSTTYMPDSFLADRVTNFETLHFSAELNSYDNTTSFQAYLSDLATSLYERGFHGDKAFEAVVFTLDWNSIYIEGALLVQQGRLAQSYVTLSDFGDKVFNLFMVPSPDGTEVPMYVETSLPTSDFAGKQFIMLVGDDPANIPGQTISASVHNEISEYEGVLGYSGVGNGSFGTATMTPEGTLTYTLNTDAAERIAAIYGDQDAFDYVSYTVHDKYGNEYIERVEVQVARGQSGSRFAGRDKSLKDYDVQIQSYIDLVGDGDKDTVEVGVNLDAVALFDGNVTGCCLSMQGEITINGALINSDVQRARMVEVNGHNLTTAVSESDIDGSTIVIHGGQNAAYNSTFSGYRVHLEAEHTALYGQDSDISIGWSRYGGALTLTGGEYALRDGASVTGQKGDDVATLSGKLHGSTYDEQVAVDMGAGDDFLRLDYSSADVIGQNVRLSGGDNTALNFGQGKLGDILSLGHEQSASAQLGGVSSRVAQGFETLHLDFADNDMDVLNLDDLLANISRAGFTGGSSFKSLVITGDGQSSSLPDMLFMDGASLTGSDIALSNKQFEGQTFDQYTAFNSDNDQIEVFVATGLWVL